MRQLFLRLFLVLSILFLLFALGRFWVIRPINCLPACSGITLNNRSLQNYDLRNAIMIETDLRGSDLRDADLTGADFSGANLAGVNLSNANLSDTRFIGANLTGADLRNTVLDGTDFSGARLSSANLTRTDLRAARLAGALLDGAQLIEIDMAGVNLSGANLNNANLTGSNLSNIVLAGGTMSNADFSGSVLQNANLNGAWINLANLSGVDLSGANLAGSGLIGSDLSSANLSDSSLVGITAVGADFSGAILVRANLTGARLFQFELEERDLTDDPALVELNELTLRQVTTSANLNGVEFTEATVWPSGKTALLNAVLGVEFAESQSDSSHAVVTADIEPPSSQAGTGDDEEEQMPTVNPEEVSGNIAVVGSSNVLSITELVVEQFIMEGYSDTIDLEPVEMHTGFQRFCQPASDIDILTSSRPIQDAELAVCATLGLEPQRFRIGTDAIAVIINPSNDFAQDVTLEELATMFTAERWNDVNPDWPAEPIVRFIPSGESGSRTLFLLTVFGIGGSEQEESNVLFDAPNTVLTPNEDRLILGVAREPNAVSFVPVNAYEQNSDILNILSINGAELNAENVATGDYPLIRPLLLYTEPTILREKPQVVAFLDYYLANIRHFNDLLSSFISGPLVLEQARSTLQEVATVVESDTASQVDSPNELQPEPAEAIEDIFTVPNPPVPLAPISPTIGLTPTLATNVTDLADLTGTILLVSNSSVVSPTQTMIDGFQALGFSGTISLTTLAENRVVESFCENDQIDIAGINHVFQDDENTICTTNARTPLPFRVGTDAIAIVANPNNDFVSNLTLEELAEVFTARQWSDVNPDWPEEPIQRFIPPTNSSVVDLFVERVLNDEADQLLLVPNLIPVNDRGKQAQGITINPYALGFMEYTAYQRNAGLLNLVAVGGVIPDDATIADDTYPLMRPLILYADENILAEKPQVAAFLNFYFTNVQVVMEPLNYVPASSQDLDNARQTLRQAVNAR